MMTEAEAERLPVVMVPLAQARFEARAQSRAALDPAWVAEFAELVRTGREIKPGVFFRDVRFEQSNAPVTIYWCASGFHRGHGHLQARASHMPGYVTPGGLRDAILFSAASNRLPGCLRRTNEDKRRSVSLLLDDEEWRHWPVARIAEHCGVSAHLVDTMHEERRAAARRLRAEQEAEARRARTSPGRAPAGAGGIVAPAPAAAAPAANGLDEEDLAHKKAQLERSGPKLVSATRELEQIQQRLADLAGTDGKPGRLMRAATKVARQAAEISEDPHYWVDRAIRYLAERDGRRRR